MWQFQQPFCNVLTVEDDGDDDSNSKSGELDNSNTRGFLTNGLVSNREKQEESWYY